ncbi:MAG TPA: hypothetical protein VLY63_32820 [Anaerolineae bacterium]|nr:hypothetical protein [Anaerolineae bacterium]
MGTKLADPFAEGTLGGRAGMRHHVLFGRSTANSQLLGWRGFGVIAGCGALGLRELKPRKDGDMRAPE